MKWDNNLCLLAYEETRKLLPIECLSILKEKLGLNFNSTIRSQWENKTSQEVYLQIIDKRYSRKLLITGVPRSGTTMFSALASGLGIPLSNDAHPPTWFGAVSWALAAPMTINPMCPTLPKKTNQSNPRPSINQVSSISIIERNILAHRQKMIQDQINKKIIENPPPPPPIDHNKIRFEHIFHQVRDPLSSIPSLTTVIPHWKRCQNEISQITPEMNFNTSIEHMALQIWVEWNSRLDKYPFIPVYRVEDFNMLDMLRSINHKHEITEYDYQCAYRKFVGFNTRSTKTERQKVTWKHIFGINVTLAKRALDMAYNYGYRYYTNSSMVKLLPKFSESFQTEQRRKQQQLQQQNQNKNQVANIGENYKVINNEEGIETYMNLVSEKYHVMKRWNIQCNLLTSGRYVPAETIAQTNQKKPPISIPRLNLEEISSHMNDEIFNHPIFIQ